MAISRNGPRGAHAQKLVDVACFIVLDLAATPFLNSAESSALEMTQRVGHVTKVLAVSCFA